MILNTLSIWIDKLGLIFALYWLASLFILGNSCIRRTKLTFSWFCHNMTGFALDRCNTSLHITRSLSIWWTQNALAIFSKFLSAGALWSRAAFARFINKCVIWALLASSIRHNSMSIGTKELFTIYLIFGGYHIVITLNTISIFLYFFTNWTSWLLTCSLFLITFCI